MDEIFKDKTVIITGASRGLGRQIALEFASHGANIAIGCNNSVAEAESLQAKISGASVHAADLSQPENAQKLIDDAMKIHNSLDFLILNAGVTLNKLIGRTTDEDFDNLININLSANARLLKAAAPYLIKSKGHAVLISAHPGVAGKQGLSAYSASKAALIGLGKSAAIELADVRVNIVLPGYMPTDMGLSASSEAIEKAKASNLLKKLNDTKESAKFVAHLCTMQNVSGQVFNLDSRVLQGL